MRLSDSFTVEEIETAIALIAGFVAGGDATAEQRRLLAKFERMKARSLVPCRTVKRATPLDDDAMRWISDMWPAMNWTQLARMFGRDRNNLRRLVMAWRAKQPADPVQTGEVTAA